MPTFIVVPYRYLVGLHITQVWDRIVYCNTLHQFQKVSKSCNPHFFCSSIQVSGRSKHHPSFGSYRVLQYITPIPKSVKISIRATQPHRRPETRTRTPDRSAGTRPPDPPSGNQKSDPPAPHPCLKTKILGHIPRIYADLTIFFRRIF